MKQKYVIVSPHQIYGGGPIVLHQLCRTLSDMGYFARILYMDSMPYQKDSDFKNWIRFFYGKMKYAVKYAIAHIFKFCGFTHTRRYQACFYEPVKGCKKKLFPFFDKNTVVVYPEIFYGNFLHAKNVVRWLLYFYRFDTYDAFGENDLVFTFREIFNDKKLNPDERQLYQIAFDFDLYRQTNFGERHGNCYIVRKGRCRKDLPDNFDGIVIDDLTEIEIVTVFNKCKYCYSYDTQTMYSTIAAICGCISVVVPEEGMARDDYLSREEHGWGIAYGDSDAEIDFALSTRSKCRELMKQRQERNIKSAEYFIHECEKKFN